MAVKPDPRIPEAFRKGNRKKVTTVAALLAELQQLPPELKVLGDLDFGVRVTVTNFNDRCLAVVFDSD